MTISTKELHATVPAPLPAVTIYSQDFNTFTGSAPFDGWSVTGTGQSMSYAWDWPGRNGTDESNRYVNTGGNWNTGQTCILQRTITGLTPGRSYTLTAWALVDAEGGTVDTYTNISIGVAGVGTSTTVAQSVPSDFGTYWSQLTYTFTATATSHAIQLVGTARVVYGGGGGNWDDVELVRNSYIGTVDLDPEGGNAALDEGWAPYGKASLTIPIPDATTLAALDPRQNPYVTITATQRTWANGTGWSDPVTRELELLVRGRVVDHNAETVTLSLTTKEAILQDAKLVATAPSYELLPYQSSVRTICATVLARHGFALQAGDTDADFTTLTSATNLIDNPNVTGGFDVRAVNATLDTNDTSWYVQGTNSINVYGPTNADSYAEIGPTLAAGNFAFGMEPGKTYTISANARVKVAGTGSDLVGPVNRARAIVVHTIDPTGSYLSGYDVYVSQNLPNTVGATARLSLTVTIKPTATAVAIRLYNGNSATQQVQFDAVMLVEGDGKETDGISPIGYFDGSTPATPNYTYAWENAANQSASTRTPRFDRTPDALTQQPGTSDYDLLEPVLQQSGLRLFADELGVWRLVDDTYHVPGRVTVSEGFNAFQAQDTISREEAAADGSPLWFDSCVIKYSWIDAEGVQQQAWDAYEPDGGGTMPAYFERSYAYPGPGMAEYYVKRVNGHGRTLALTAAVDYTATPGMEASSSLPGTEDQTGYVSSVSWDFLADTMTVGTRALIDTPPSAWIQLPIGEQWLDSPAGASWTDEEV